MQGKITTENMSVEGEALIGSFWAEVKSEHTGDMLYVDSLTIGDWLNSLTDRQLAGLVKRVNLSARVRGVIKDD